MQTVLACVMSLVLSAAPAVTITSPAGGWTGERIVKVAGTVSDKAIERGVLLVNGAAQGLAVSDGKFETDLVLSPGMNTLEVVATNAEGTGRAQVRLLARAPRKDLKIVLNWDAPGTDVDLWVTDPAKEKCYHQSKNTKNGGSLDVDITNGFGPETFTQARAVPGTYLVQAHYYSSQVPTRVTVTMVLYEGTPRERRQTYAGVLLRAGDIATVAELAVEP